MFSKSYSRILVYFWLLWCLGCQHQTSRQETTDTAEAEGYQVIAIKDGDTIEILKDGKPLRVRLYGIDAPEKNQDFGTRSQQYTASLVFGKRVGLEVKGSDRYGRTIGIIYLADGRSLNEELVRAGLAWHYTDYSKDANLAALEVEARQARRGLWAGPQPTSPWEFRKSRRAPRAPGSAAGDSQAPGGRRLAANTQVYICESQGASTYHLNRQCRQLKNCRAAIRPVTYQAATQVAGRKACKVCAR